jgi:hypothetical protein
VTVSYGGFRSESFYARDISVSLDCHSVSVETCTSFYLPLASGALECGGSTPHSKSTACLFTIKALQKELFFWHESSTYRVSDSAETKDASMDTNLSGVRVKVRRLGSHDLYNIVRAVRQTQAQPWRGWAFLAGVRPADIVGCIAEVRGHLIGFALCTPVRQRENAPPGWFASLRSLSRRLLGKQMPIPVYLNLLDVLICGEWSRSPAERELLDELNRELGQLGDPVQIIVPETKLRVQVYLHEAGYQALRVLHGYFGDEDGYLMEHRSGGGIEKSAAKQVSSAAQATVQTS